MATIFNDLVGDICGTVSGAAGAAIVFQLGHARPTLDEGLATVVLVSLIAAATVGGKAMGKSVAIYRADEITLQVGRVMWWLEEKLGLVILADSASRRSTRRRVALAAVSLRSRQASLRASPVLRTSRPCRRPTCRGWRPRYGSA